MKNLKTFNELNEAEVTPPTKDQFAALIINLNKAKVPCKAYLYADRVVVECGWDYPDRIFDKVSDAAEAAGITGNQIDVCADHGSGETPIAVERLNGGAKRY